MLRFEPPGLQDELASAIETWKGKIDISEKYDFSEDIVDVTDPDFNPAEYKDQTITYQTEFSLGLPRWEDVVQITYGEFIELSHELSRAILVDGRECRTGRRYLLRVSPANDQATSYLWHTLPDAESEIDLKLQEEYLEHSRDTDLLYAKLKEEMFEADIYKEDEHFDEELYEAWQRASQQRRTLSEAVEKRTQRYCTLGVSLNGYDLVCSLTEGFTVFGAAVAATGDYSKDFPPVMWDTFVEVRYRRPISPDTARYVADAYLFELSSTLGLEFKVDPRLAMEDVEWYPEGELQLSNARLRPLLLGKGMPELLKLYNQALAAFDDAAKVLYFAKVIEYVSQTVVRQQATEAIRAKLLSPRAVIPDASYIAELQAIVEDQRVFRKDRESMKQTAVICCEATELSHRAPPFLSKLCGILPSDSPKRKEEALAELGYSLSATRNLVAHAKANYEPTGEECPDEQLAAFAECIKLAAQQAVRWYASRPEDIRVL